MMDPELLFTHRALGAAALSWVLKRGIHLASLQLPNDSYHRMEAAEKQSTREAVASLVLNGRLDKLETISINRCSYIKDADLEAVLSKCYKSVKSIDTRYWDQAGSWGQSVAQFKRCTKLEEFTPQGNESAADMVEIFQACRKLRRVDLTGFGSHRLTDEVVLNVAVNCHLLENLDFGGCSGVSDAALSAVAESCPLLQCVHFSEANITDATVASLCNQCPLLKRIFLNYCINLTDAAVLAVAETLPGLTHINLGGLEAITSSAVETLASKCRALEYIDLEGCTNVGDATLMKIAEHCSNLEALYVELCSRITAVVAAEIRSKCSKLEIFFYDGEHGLLVEVEEDEE